MKKAVTSHSLRLFDSHCHFDFDEFAHAFGEELEQARLAHVERIMIPSVGKSNWQRVKALATQYPSHIFYALGFHPYFLHSFCQSQVSELEQLIAERDASCVAIGECGLDNLVDVDASLQETVLKLQLSMAGQAKLPVILHSRKTHNRLLQLIKQQKFRQGGVLHAFSGSEQQAKQFIDLGFKIGVGGVITYPRANKTRQAIARLPIDALVLETDAPDMPICGKQGQANHPKYIQQVLNELVLLRGEEKHLVAEQLWDNTQDLFGLKC